MEQQLGKSTETMFGAENKSIISIEKVAVEILEEGIEVCCLPITNRIGNLFELELGCIKNAVANRKHEFSTGRVCARRALAKLNIDQCPILVGDFRQPLWPIGIVGSISHDGDYCIACVAKEDAVSFLGIDLADSAPLDIKLIPMICTENEIKTIEKISDSCLDVDPFKIVFSIKESVFKCLFPLVNQIFDFHDASVDLDFSRNVATIILCNRRLFAAHNLCLKARFQIVDSYVFSVVWV